MKKKMLLTLVAALMILGLYSTASFAATRVYEGTTTLQPGTYEFYPTESTAYHVIFKDSAGQTWTSYFHNADGTEMISLQQNQKYEFEIEEAVTATIEKNYAGQLRQGEFAYNFGTFYNSVIYTLVVSGGTDNFHFASTGSGDPYIEVFKGTSLSETSSVNPTSGNSDDADTGLNFECTYRLDPGVYYVMLGCFREDTGTVGKLYMTHDAHGIANAIQANGYIEQKCFVCNYVAARGFLPPATPAIATKNIKKKTLALTIAPAQYATQYQVQYATKKNFKGAKNLYTATGVNAIKKLKKGKTYYVRVRSLNNGGFSAWSAVKKVKIKK